MNINKRYGYPLLLIMLLVVFSPAPRKVLFDIVSNTPAPEFSIQWPELRYYIEPISGINEYLLSFSRYILQLLSWMLWLGIFAGLIRYFRKDKLANTFLRALKFETAFLSIVMLCLILPLPGPKLNAPKLFRALDLHSHTFYSHDGLKSPLESLDYHEKLGFDNFFVTEHGHTAGFNKFDEKNRFSVVYPGMQVSTTERVSLVILADKQFDGAEYLHKSVKDVIDLAHKNGFVVICPHWWKWRHFTWQQLYEMGIDGFEVYNAGYRKFSDKERRQMIDFCRERSLLVLGSTDWHGWGYSSNVWTLIEKTGDVSKFNFDSLRGHITTKVLVLKRPGEINNTFRYIFEPYFGAYYYFGSLEFEQIFYWIVWIVLLIIAFHIPYFGVFLRFAPLILAAVFLGFSVLSIYTWIPLLPENQILGKLLTPIFIGIAAAWFVIFKYRKS